MSVTKVWHYSPGRGEAWPDGTILDALLQAGIKLHAVDPPAPGGPGVLFFDRITPHLSDFLREASRCGVGRVLAVAISDTALDNRGVWGLLQAGASDVFSWDHSDAPAQEVAARFRRWK